MSETLVAFLLINVGAVGFFVGFFIELCKESRGWRVYKVRRTRLKLREMNSRRTEEFVALIESRIESGTDSGRVFQIDVYGKRWIALPADKPQRRIIQ